MKSDLDYWIAIDKRKERYLKMRTEQKCKMCGTKCTVYKFTKMPLCRECYRRKFMDSLKAGQPKAVIASKAQRGGNNERK